MKKFLSFLLPFLLLLPFAACQENPEGSIVVHKDMDNLISKAQEDDPSKVEAADILDEVTEHFETYVTSIEDENLGVTVNVNAKVDVPEVDKLSVYRVKQKKFDQEFIDKVRKALMGDKEVYMGQALTTLTKADYEVTIKYYRDYIREEEEKMAAASEKDRTFGPQDNRYVISVEEFREWCQQNIDATQSELNGYQEKYEQAPTELNLQEYPSDGQLLTYQELSARYPEFADEYYASFYGDDETLFLGTDGSDGQYQVLEVTNSEELSNKLSYTSCPGQYVSVLGVWGKLDNNLTDGSDTFDHVSFNSTVPEDFLGGTIGFTESTVFTPLENEETTITMDKALSVAEEFLSDIDLYGFTFAEGGLYNEPVDLLNQHGTNVEGDGIHYYRHYYILRFYRDLDGTLLTQSSGRKVDWGENDGYRTQFWPGELVELRVNDQGIAGFHYESPVEITETVVDGAALKPFSEIKDTFEKMICIVNANDQRISWIDIDRVQLSYSRISERDSFDTGLVVPVWSFEGKMDTAYRGSEDFVQQWKADTIMAINAIDGSIIDGELGY
ncbi:MAG: hypothetical protein J1E06_08210 [Acutalibacter sp.]|nr:hypothetical protein [Acutalibacter sp.]